MGCEEAHCVCVSIGNNRTEGTSSSSMVTNVSPSWCPDHRERASAQAKAAGLSLWSFPGGNGSIWAPKMPLAVKPRLLQKVGLGMEGLD